MNASVQKALEEADKIVVFLPQNIVEIRKFFHLYSSIIPKAIFLILDYRTDQKGDTVYLWRNYGISADKSGVIPYNEAYCQAGEEGKVETFIHNNLGESCKKENVYFMQCIKEASDMILGYPKEKESYELSE